MQKYVAEGIGTFSLVGAGSLAMMLSEGDSLTVGLAIGLAYAVCAFLFYKVSGAHFNPATTVAAHLKGDLTGHDVYPYWIAQFGGSVAAILLLSQLFPDNAFLGSVLFGRAVVLQVFLIEFLFTLILIILHLQTMERLPKMVGVNVGSYLVVSTLILLRFSGGSMNPARAIAPVVVTANPYAASQIWLFVTTSFLAAIVAGLLLRHGKEPKVSLVRS